MDEEEYDRVLSVLKEAEGASREHSGISEFKEQLKEPKLEEEKTVHGWVLYAGQLEGNTTEVRDRIITLLKYLVNHTLQSHYLVQFWAAMEVKGKYMFSTKHQPFCVTFLNKGLCWYRNQCTDYVYSEAEGAVGRAYLKKQPESTPDLRLYSTTEFPMRDLATRCGFKGSLALPLFDTLTNRCYGVLEQISGYPKLEAFQLSIVDQGLQEAELRSTHINSIPISRNYTINTPKHQPEETEITEILNLAIKAIPGLYLAQVWVPCKQCPNKSTNLCCMKRASFINSRKKEINMCDDTDCDMFAYLQTCELHNLQIDLGCIHQNSCDLSISQNSWAHYAARARLSFCHTIHLKSVHNNSDTYVFEFFLHPNSRQNACGDSSLQLLLRIIEVKLENFKLASGGQQLRQPNPFELESVDMLKVITNSHKETFSEQDFKNNLEMVELCGLRLPSEGNGNGWVFCWPTREDSESLHAGVPVKKIELFLNKIAAKLRENCYRMVQFWAPVNLEDKCYLETSYQPFTLDCLAKGLAYFRKECMKHHYRVDDEAKEEELGPPGRVFRNGLPEISPDLSFYSTEEFAIRNYAVHCGFQKYFVLPVFDEDNPKPVGVLEFIGFDYNSELDSINGELEEVKLSSNHNNSFPRFLGSGEVKLSSNYNNSLPRCLETGEEDNDVHRMSLELDSIYEELEGVQLISNLNNSSPGFLRSGEEDNDITRCRKTALTEIRDAINLIIEIPQLYMANVWVRYEEDGVGTNTDVSCMELLAMVSESSSRFMPTDQIHRVHVRPKKGIIGKVLATESHSCFCRNLRGFGIADQPLLHYEMRDRRDVCFAICLQSSHTGDVVYVLEFFLYQGPATYEYLDSFLSFLLPIMKQRLKTFKMASGKQLGEEFAVEVIEFSEGNKLTSSKQHKFKSVLNAQEEHQYLEEQQVQSDSVSYATQMLLSQKRSGGGGGAAVAVPPCGFKKTKGSKKKLSLEVLEKQFGKKLKDAAKDTGCSISTIKRVCRDYGIARWPNKKKHTESSTTSLLSERECSWDPQNLQASSSSNLVQLDSSSQHITVQEGAEKVIVMVKYKEDTIKFEFCLSLGVVKLSEEVATKLILKQGGFKLKYVDEDEQEILLTWNDDLHLCPKSRTKTGKTCMHFFVD